jgi:serine/threonine-protein kinase RsbW
MGVSSAVVYDVLLAVNELVMNIVSHGYRGAPGVIEIDMRRTGRALEIRLRDQAPPFDPTLVPAPDTTLPLEQRPIGGLGIHMARHFVNTMTYRPLSGGGNELTLVKNDVVIDDAGE